MAVSFVTMRLKRQVWWAGITLAVLSGCDSGTAQCSSDSDCQSSKTCVAGWFGGTCEPRCTTNADCARTSFCNKLSIPFYCEQGCRDSADCPETAWCNVGACVFGCVDSPHICDEGRPGSVCVGAEPAINGVIQGDQEGFCHPSCQTDADCESASVKQCLCGACSSPCTPNDCGSGACRKTPDCQTPRCFPN